MSRSTRPIRIEGEIAYIPLTKGYEAVIDARDVPLVDGRNWCASVDLNTVYAMRRDNVGGKWKNIKLHRVLMGEPLGFEVDHRDGNGLNNRRQGETGNLRLATHGQNKRNSRYLTKGAVGLKGVKMDRRCNKYQARICAFGRTISLGYFSTPEDAHEAYCKASADLHGSFGRTK